MGNAVEARIRSPESLYITSPVPIGKDIFVVSGQLHHTTTAATVLVKDRKSTILFDPGSSAGFQQFLTNLSLTGTSPADITDILLTHFHPDHASATKELLKKIEEAGGSATVYGPVGSRDLFDDELARFVYPDQPYPRFRVDTEITHKQTLEFDSLTVQGYHAPGHTHVNMAYYVKTEHQQLLIAGDTLPGTAIDPRLGSKLEPYYDSQLMLSEVPAPIATEGHGNPEKTLKREELLKRIPRARPTKSDLAPNGFHGLWTIAA